MFFADFSEHLNKLNVKLHGSGKALDVTFGNIKTFEKKLKVSKNDIGDERSKFFSNLKRHTNDLQNVDKTDLQSLQKLFLNIIESVGERLLQDFQSSENSKRQQNS